MSQFGEAFRSVSVKAKTNFRDPSPKIEREKVDQIPQVISNPGKVLEIMSECAMVALTFISMGTQQPETQYIAWQKLRLAQGRVVAVDPQKFERDAASAQPIQCLKVLFDSGRLHNWINRPPPNGPCLGLGNCHQWF